MSCTVLIPETYGNTALSAIDGVHPVVYGEGADPDEVAEAAEQAQVIIVSFFAVEPARNLIPHLPRLQLMQSLSAGTEFWEPLVPAGVTLCNASGANGGVTAELAVAALLALTRQIPQAVHQQAARQWTPITTDTLLGKRALVIGAGDVGRNVRDRLTPFGVAVTLVGRTARDGIVSLDDIPALLGTTDIVVLAVPLVDDTHHLVDKAFLAALPDGAVIVNVARGAVVDATALLAELRSGRLHAALDVTDPEPLPATDELWTAPNLLLTSHRGGNTTGWHTRSWAIAVDQIDRLVNGRPLHNVTRSAPGLWI